MAELTTKPMPSETIEDSAGQPRSFHIITLIVYGLVFGLLALLGWGLVQVNSGQVESGMAPDFTIASFEGETITLSELR